MIVENIGTLLVENRWISLVDHVQPGQPGIAIYFLSPKRTWLEPQCLQRKTAQVVPGNHIPLKYEGVLVHALGSRRDFKLNPSRLELIEWKVPQKLHLT